MQKNNIMIFEDNNSFLFIFFNLSLLKVINIYFIKKLILKIN